MQFKQSMINLLLAAQLAGREVDLTHDEGSGVITDVSTTVYNTTSVPLQVDAVEVTQAIQDLGHSIPLFAGKRTVVRVYLSYYASPGITVRGQISVRRSSTDTPMTVASENAVVLDPTHAGDIAVKRDDVTRSLNFVLPNSHITEGPLSIRIASIMNDVTDTSISFGCERRPTVWFHRSASMRVRVLGMRYQQSGVTYTPSNLDFDLIESWLRRVMPVGNVNMTRAVVDVTAAVPFGCGDINAQVAAIRALDVAAGTDARTHYFGLVSDGGFWMRGCSSGVPSSSPEPGTVASGPTGGGTWGWDFDGSYGDWYTAHELGHTYGRLHPGFCGEDKNDLDNFPFNNGQLANSNMSFAGFDIGDPTNGLLMAALPGTQWHDVMTYCSFQWICAYTYLGMHRRLAEEDALPAVSAHSFSGSVPGMSAASTCAGRPDRRFPNRVLPPQEKGLTQEERSPKKEVLLNVIATVNLTKREGKIRYVNPLERSTPSPLAEKGEATLRVKGSDGRVLKDYYVKVKLNSELAAGEDLKGIVDAVIVVTLDTRSIELLFDNYVADMVLVGGDMPAMRGLTVVDTGGNDVGVGINVYKAIAGNVTYSVQVSTDNGQTWQTLAVGLKEPTMKLDRSQFREGQDVQIRMLATNGLTTSVVATESFRVLPRKTND
jgi:hypothetical protein